MKRARFLVAAFLAGALVAGNGPAQAGEMVPAEKSDTGDDWKFTGNLYLWGAGIDARTQSGAEIGVDFSDLAENLNFAIMGGLEARKSEWFFAADVIFMDLSAGKSSSVPLPIAPGTGFTINTITDLDLTAWVLNFVAGHALLDTKHFNLGGFIGARYLDIDSTLDVTVTIGPLMRSARIPAGASVWDGIIGVRGSVNIDENWFLPYHADVGAGQSDLTWQAMGGVGYRFSWGEVILAYRHLEWDSSSDRRLDLISFSGPGLAAKFYFN